MYSARSPPEKIAAMPATSSSGMATFQPSVASVSQEFEVARVEYGEYALDHDLSSLPVRSRNRSSRR